MTFLCPHPWQSLIIETQEDYKPCCKFIPSLGKSFDEYFNSEGLKRLKQDFIEGKQPEGCQRCWNDEAAGLPSKRQMDSVELVDGSIPNNQLKYMTLFFGTTCNLACMTCSSHASSKWINQEKKLQKDFNSIKIYEHKKFYNDKKFLNELEKNSHEIIKLDIAGGEPFLTGITQHLKYLDFLITNNLSRNISLKYITNATIFPGEEFFGKWTNFKEVEFHLSIDGIEEKYEYMRWPAKWKTTYENIKRYQELVNQNETYRLSLSYTVSSLNLLDVKDFFIWCHKQKLPEPYLGMVEKPSNLNIRNLPSEVKNLVKSKLNGKKFDPIINYMFLEHNNTLESTRSWILAVDKIRKQNYHDVFPEMANLLFK